MRLSFSFPALHCQAPVILGFLLLIRPDVHYKAMGYQLHKKYLKFHRETVDRIILFRLVQVFQAGGYHISGFIQPVERLYLLIIGLESVVEKLRFHPAGIHRHDPNAVLL